MKIPPALQALSTKAMALLSKYSLQQESVVGIDIAINSIRVAELTKKGATWELDHFAHHDITPPANVHTVTDNPEFYASELATLLKESNITTTNAAIPLAVSSAVIKVVTIPLMNAEELEKAIQTKTLWENVVQLTEELSEYSIFYQVLTKHSNLNTMDLLFVASRLVDIQGILNVVQTASLMPVVIDVRCFTLKNAFDNFLPRDMKDKSTAILEMGDTENYLMVLKDGAPYIAEIFVRPQDRTVLAKSDTDPTAIGTTLDRFSLQIMQALSAFEAKFHGHSPTKLFVASQFGSTDELLKGLQTRLPKVTVEAFNPFIGIAIPEKLNSMVSAITNPTLFATTMGLASRKLDIFGYFKYVVGSENINLLPNRERLKMEGRANLFGGLALAFGLVFLLTVGSSLLVNYLGESSANEEELEDYVAIQEVVASREEKKQGLEQQKSNIANPFSHLSIDPLKTNQRWSFDALQALTLAMPENVQLTRITYDGDSVIKLEGRGDNERTILMFVDQLHQSEDFTEARSSMGGTGRNTARFTSSTLKKLFSIELTIAAARVKTDEADTSTVTHPDCEEFGLSGADCAEYVSTLEEEPIEE